MRFLCTPGLHFPRPCPDPVTFILNFGAGTRETIGFPRSSLREKSSQFPGNSGIRIVVVNIYIILYII